MNTILTQADIDRIAKAYEVEKERLPVLRAIVSHANERAAIDGMFDGGEPTLFLRAAAHCLVVIVLARGDRDMQRTTGSTYWNLIGAHREAAKCTTVH